MPQAVAAAAVKAALFVSGTLAAIGVPVAVASAIGTVTFYAVTIGGPLLLLKTISKALAPRLPESGVNRERILEYTTGGNLAGRIVYGTARVGGQLIIPPRVSGSSSEYLWFVLVWTCHEIDSFVKVYLGDDELDVAADFDGSGFCTLSRYIDSSSNKLLQVKHYDGSQTTSDAGLTAAFTEWTSAHKLQGLAYSVFRLEQDLTASPTVWANGPPRQFAVRIKGAKVYDPRPTPVTAWSDNAALCLRDYLTADYGLNLPASAIDDDAVDAAADICDESVTVKDNAGGTTTQNRWTCNGVLSTGTAPAANIEQLASAMGGTAIYTAGEWQIFAAAYTTPTVTIDETYLAGPVKLVPQAPAAERANLVAGSYVPYDRGGIPVPFPARENATYQTDDGATLERNIELPLTDDTQRAQRLAVLALKQSRNWQVLELVCNLKAFEVRVWDTVQVTLAELNYTAKIFRVIGWQYQPHVIRLLLRAESSAAYDVTAADDLADDPAVDDFTD